MKITNILLFAFAVLFAANVSAQDFRVEPPSWWIGMNNEELQLMVYGDEISETKVSISYPGVELYSVVQAQSPNYIFLNLRISDDAKAGNFDINFKKGKKTVATYNYVLNARGEGSATRESYDNSDVIYLLMPDRFANGDAENDSHPDYEDKLNMDDLHGRHGGDIEGIIQKLDYLEELGITAIWSTPMLEDAQKAGSYHGYATTDFYKVDPRYGSNELYKKLADELHARDMKLIMDMIPNHCGSEHAWLKDYPFNDWLNFQENYQQTNYRIHTTADPYVSKGDSVLNFDGWFVSEMPDMNQNNEFLLTYLKQFSIWWVEYAGLDGIRVDTYPYNDPVKAAEWTNAILAEYPHLNIVGECWQHTPAEVAYWQTGTKNPNGYDSGLPSVMDFALSDAINRGFNEDEQGWNGGVGQLWQTLTMDYLYGDAYNLVTFAENHDTQRFSTVVGNDVDKYKLAFTFLFTTRGIPQIYYGSEHMMGGDKGKGDGDIRRDMPGAWPGDERSVFDESGRTNVENEVFNHFSTLLNWRKSHSVIHDGQMLHFIPQNNVYVYFRYNEEETVMVILNNNPEAQTVDVERYAQKLVGYSKGVDILTGTTIDTNNNFTIKGRSSFVLELK